MQHTALAAPCLYGVFERFNLQSLEKVRGGGGGVTLVKGKLFADGIRQPELPFVLFSFSYGRRYAIFVLYDEFCNLRNKANFTLSL